MTDTLISDLTQMFSARSNAGVISAREELLTYECDGSTMEKFPPNAVVFPESTADVARIVRYLHERRVPFVARGAGTGLSGGMLAIEGGVIIETSRMNHIIEIDPVNRCAVAEPGVENIRVSRAAAEHGLYYAPDPSSQAACTIGGNVAENAGGPHTLKYGATAQHVLGLEIVLPDGEILALGGNAGENPGYDFIGAITGSEGTFGIVTKITLRLLPLPQDVRTLLAVFETVHGATQTVSDIIAAGIVPAALEMMDNTVLHALEEAFHYGFPLDAGALLIIEVDGFAASLERQAGVIRAICEKSNAREVRIAGKGADRDALWRARKRAFGALGRITPSYYTQDGVIPRHTLPDILDAIKQIGAKHDLRIANIFHAGDGNLHPCILFDERDANQRKNVLAAGDEILLLCVRAGGSLSGEHGIGIEKMKAIGYMFTETDQQWMRGLRSVFNPDGLCNPGKIFPTGKTCVEVDVRHRKAAL